MEELTKIINNATNNEYDFLKLQSVVYDKEKNMCTITFLYPENQSDITEDQKQIITQILSKNLNLHAKICLKFKKCFLSKPLVCSLVFSHLKQTHQSVAFSLSRDCVECEITPTDIIVTLLCDDGVYEYFKNNDVVKEIKDLLSLNFISNAEVSLKKENKLKIDANEILTQKITLPPLQTKQIPRYEVHIYKTLVGHEINPFAEYFKNISAPKQSVVLSGVIESIEKKTYVRARDKQKPDAPTQIYYVLKLNQHGTIFPATIFAARSNEKKLDKYLVLGANIICIGDVKNSMSHLCYYPKHISLCTAIEGDNRSQSDGETYQTEYLCIKPQKYESKSQENMFLVDDYDDFIMNNTFVVYDFETTGLDSDQCEIIEIGACKIKQGNIVETFQTFIKPKYPIPPEITNLTSITNKMVSCAPKMQDAICDFNVFCRDCILAGYNNVLFDNKFLQAAANKSGTKFDHVQVDALVMARKSLRLNSYKLGNVVKALGITLDGAHRAINDAIATAKVMLRLHNRALQQN